MSQPRREIESKLVAPGEAPAQRLHTLLAAGGIDGLELGPMSEQSFRDRYFDTSTGQLARAGLALRVRTAERTSTLTLKGGAVEVAGGISRVEIEGEWSPATLAAVQAHLPAGGIEFHPQPMAALASAGLRVIQDRWAVRQTRVATWAGSPCAEVALDQVDFPTPIGGVRLIEAEIELLPGAAGELLPGLVQALRRAAPELWPWRHSKLAVGLAIAALVGRGELKGGVLDAEGLKRIEAWLGSEQAHRQG